MRKAALAAVMLASSFAYAGDDTQHVTVIELEHTKAAMKATYTDKRRVPLPRVIVFDGKRQLLIAETGYNTKFDKQLHEAVQHDKPLALPITLEMVLSETQDAHGDPVTIDRIPAADLYVVDFWAEWCGPCHMLAHALTDTLNHWDGVRSVWIKIESDPRKERRHG